MKHLLLLFFISFAVIQSSASNLVIGVIVPDNQEKIDNSACKMLQTRIQQLMTSIGCSSMQRSGLIVYPTINILNEELVEGGLKNIYITEFEITLFIYHIDTKTHFGSYAFNVKGNGNTFAISSKNAFSKLRNNDIEFSKFMNITKQKIYSFFESYLDELLNRAKAYNQMKQYEDALALLYSYPEGISGYDKVNDLMVEVFKSYQNANCNQMMQQAQGYIAKRDYESALSILSMVDATSPCSSESKKMIKEVEEKIYSEISEAYKREEKAQERKERKQRMIVNAIRDVVTAYCNRTQPSITYKNIFK